MHLDIIVEGIQDQVLEFEKWWSTRTFPLKIKTKEGQDTQAIVQIALRERKMYSLIFPKEALDIVLNTLNPENCIVSRVDGKGTKQWGAFLNMIRKLLKLNKIKEIDKTKGLIPMRSFNDVRVVALGTRDDIDVTEADGSVHEGL